MPISRLLCTERGLGLGKRVARRRPPPLPTPLALAQHMAISWITVFRSCFLVMFLAYPGVSLKVLRVFKCRKIAGVSYLEADMRLQVRAGEQWPVPCAHTLAMPPAPGPCLSPGNRCLLPSPHPHTHHSFARAVLHWRVGWLRHLQPDCRSGVRRRPAAWYVRGASSVLLCIYPPPPPPPRTPMRCWWFPCAFVFLLSSPPLPPRTRASPRGLSCVNAAAVFLLMFNRRKKLFGDAKDSFVATAQVRGREGREGREGRGLHPARPPAEVHCLASHRGVHLLIDRVPRKLAVPEPRIAPMHEVPSRPPPPPLLLVPVCAFSVGL